MARSWEAETVERSGAVTLQVDRYDNAFINWAGVSHQKYYLG